MSSKWYRSAGFPVPRKSRQEIRRIALGFLARLQRDGWQTVPFPALELVEHWGASTDLGHPNVDFFADEDLPDRDGDYIPHRNLFRLRESVYLRAVDGDPSAIETFTHEISHALLNHPTPSLARGYDPKKFISVVSEEDREHQANWCMDELSMPFDKITGSDSIRDIMDRFAVNLESATRRQSDLIRERSRQGIR